MTLPVQDGGDVMLTTTHLQTVVAQALVIGQIRLVVGRAALMWTELQRALASKVVPLANRDVQDAKKTILIGIHKILPMFQERTTVLLMVSLVGVGAEQRSPFPQATLFTQ